MESSKFTAEEVSILSDIESISDSEPDSPSNGISLDSKQVDDPNETPNARSVSSAARSVADLIKSFSTRSSPVIDHYRRDLSIFLAGFTKETAEMRAVASRAVKDLPVSLDVGTAVAQESLESLGQAFDDISSTVWRGTSKVISHGRKVLRSAKSNRGDDVSPPTRTLRRYGHFEAQIAGIQSDPATYWDEPEDAEEFEKWKLEFSLKEKAEEIDNLRGENRTVKRIYAKLVPNVVDHDTFWSRYFYRLYKLKRAGDARVEVVKRTASREEDEDMSWDAEDDLDTNANKTKTVEGLKCVEEMKLPNKETEIINFNVESDEKKEAGESSKNGRSRGFSSEKSGCDEGSLESREVKDVDISGGKMSAAGIE